MCIKMSHTNYVSHAVCSPREINAFIKHAVKIWLKVLGQVTVEQILLYSLIDVDRLDVFFSRSSSHFHMRSDRGSTTQRHNFLDAQAASMWESPPNSSAPTLLSHLHVTQQHNSAKEVGAKGKGSARAYACAHTHIQNPPMSPIPKSLIQTQMVLWLYANQKACHGSKIHANQRVRIYINTTALVLYSQIS